MSEEDKKRTINEENNRFTKCMRGNPEVTMIPRLQRECPEGGEKIP
jgi:hypothetical protein